MPNGDNTGGPNLGGPHRVIWIAFVLLCVLLAVALRLELGGTPW